MKRLKIVYSDGAMGDILAITDFIARDSDLNVVKAIDRLEARVRTLGLLPARGRVVPELHWHGINTVREIFERPWRILYQIKDGSVLVVAVYDGRRHLNDVLLERFLRH